MNTYARCVLRYGNEWPTIQRATAAEPSCPMAWLLQTDFFIAVEVPSAASEALARASALITALPSTTAASPPPSSASPSSSSTTAATQLAHYHSAWSLWLKDDLEEAGRAFEAALTVAPGDPLALKRSQLLYFLAGRPQDMLRVSQRPDVVTAQSGTGYYHGMTAFAMEQVGDSAGAEAEGRLGTRIDPTDPWSHHAVAHALYNQARLAEGLQWLRSHEANWVDLCSFMVTHNHFHIALNLLDMGDIPACLRHYDASVWGVDKGCMQDEMGALGLLAKIHLRSCLYSAAAGVEAGTMTSQSSLPQLAPSEVLTRLQDVCSYCTTKLDYHGDPFFDALMAYGFAACGMTEELEKLTASAKLHISTLGVRRRAAVEVPWVAAMSAMSAIGFGRFADAKVYFQSFALPDYTSPLPNSAAILDSSVLGNSAEQRDVLDEAFLLSLAVAGETDLALKLSRKRSELRPNVAADAQTQALCSVGRDDKAATVLFSAASEYNAMHARQLIELSKPLQ